MAGGPDLSVLGAAPQGFDAEPMPVLPPPSDVPPAPALQPAQVGGAPGSYGGDRQAPSKDPHWVYCPSAVLLRGEAYWARYEASLEAGVRAEAPGAKEALDYLRNNGTEQWRMSAYVTLACRKHQEGYPALYAPEVLDIMAIAPLVELERQTWKAQVAASGARARQAAIQTRIAAMDDIPPKAKAAVLLALAEVAGEENG